MAADAPRAYSIRVLPRPPHKRSIAAFSPTSHILDQPPFHQLRQIPLGRLLANAELPLDRHPLDLSSLLQLLKDPLLPRVQIWACRDIGDDVYHVRYSHAQSRLGQHSGQSDRQAVRFAIGRQCACICLRAFRSPPLMANFGSERLVYFHPYRTLAEHGVTVGSGSGRLVCLLTC